MKSNSQKSSDLGVPFKSTRQHIFLKCDLNLPDICFRLSIWPNGQRESQKNEFVKWIPRTNEATRLIVVSPNPAQMDTQLQCALLIRPRKYMNQQPRDGTHAADRDWIESTLQYCVSGYQKITYFFTPKSSDRLQLVMFLTGAWNRRASSGFHAPNSFSQSSLVQFILPISKEASPASILGRIWCDVSSRTCLAGLSVLLRKAKCTLFYSRVLRVV